MSKSFAGLRIRERRRALALTQAELAHRAGISPSYLNLIEHNKRAVRGRVLAALAHELELPPSALSKEAELSLMGELRQAAAELPADAPETDATEEFASRYPGWARLLNTLYRQTTEQSALIEALSDRMTHDPFLQKTLHEMLTRITAVHSTAGILASVDDLPDARRERFVTMLDEESARLAEVAGAMTGYFDRALAETRPTSHPTEMVERFLTRFNHRFPQLDSLPEKVDATARIDAILDDAAFGDDAARAHARRVLEEYREDAQALPYRSFMRAAVAHGYDPLGLSREFGVPVGQVLRRLSHLPRAGSEEQLFARITVNAAGFVIYRSPLPSFPMPRHGAPCALWPAFRSLSLPGALTRVMLDLPSGERFVSLARADYLDDGSLAAAAPVRSTMIAAPFADLAGTAVAQGLAEPGQALAVGTGCRICTRVNCAARAEAPVMTPPPA